MSRTGAATLKSFLAEERAAVEAALARVVARAWADAPGSRAAARHALDAGGKRLRPILCVAACRAVGGRTDAPAVHELACAIELIHTYSLVHDDLPCMDDDDLRRGRPTAHRVYGTGVATVAAAGMISAAFQTLDAAGDALGLDRHERAELAATLARAAGAGGMVAGQVLDLAAEGRHTDIGALGEIHRRKTGALFAGAARLGALAGRADAETVTALEAYGGAVGLAFQVADDILDETGASVVLGKAAGRDRALGKATYPALLGVAGARATAERAAAQADAALARIGLHDDVLRALARFAVERDR